MPLKQQLHLPYGGLNIMFPGDMRQLEPGKWATRNLYTKKIVWSSKIGSTASLILMACIDSLMILNGDAS
jgi:hypothetical protein